MATPAQIAANQANAEHSTGPRTEAGKARTRTNATRHGLCSTTPVMADEDQAEFNLLHADLLAEYQPATPTEDILVYKMAANFFAFARAETLLAERLDFNDDEDQSKQVSLMLRYRNTADRHFNQNLNQLRKIQKERCNAEAAAPASDPIGSVPQNTETAPAEPAAEHPKQAQPAPIPTIPAAATPEIGGDVPSAAPDTAKKAA